MVSMATAGRNSGKSPIMLSTLTRGRPSMRDMSALVSPDSRADLAAAITPEAGPESIVRTGIRAASPMETVPPFDWVIRTGQPIPIARRPSSSRRNRTRGVHHANKSPLIFPLLGPRLPGRADEEIGPTLGDDRLGFALMDRIDVGMQKADGHGRDARAKEFLDPLRHGIRLERAQDGPVRADSPPHLPDVGPADQWHRSGGFEAGRIGKPGSTDLQDVPKSFRYQKPGRNSCALNDRVDRQGGSCAEVDDVRRVQAFAPESFPHPVQHTGNRIVDDRGNLVDADPARRLLHQGDVRKGASYVHADPPAAQWRLPLTSWPGIPDIRSPVRPSRAILTATRISSRVIPSLLSSGLRAR